MNAFNCYHIILFQQSSTLEHPWKIDIWIRIWVFERFSLWKQVIQVLIYQNKYCKYVVVVTIELSIKNYPECRTLRRKSPLTHTKQPLDGKVGSLSLNNKKKHTHTTLHIAQTQIKIDGSSVHCKEKLLPTLNNALFSGTFECTLTHRTYLEQP